MRRNFTYLLIFLLCWALPGKAQLQLTPVLVGSAGSHTVHSGGSITASVGEAVITTASGSGWFLTQGFNQPRVGGDIFIQVDTVRPTCLNSVNGSIRIVASGGTAPYFYSWSNGSTSDSIMNASVGDYVVTITDASGLVLTDTISLQSVREEECKIHIYSGITPNGDGRNESWIIDNIGLFPDNRVQIFNRWGDMVWSASGYDNVDVLWNGTNQRGEPLPSGTYFYIVDIDGQLYQKSWVELTR